MHARNARAPHLVELRERAAWAWLALILGLAPLACAGPDEPSKPPRDTISILSPRCAGVSSCVLGHVTAAGTAAPIAKAAVFLERELQGGEAEPIRMQALTDEQGVFTVVDPPPGSYRVAVYKDASSVTVMGMELGRAGTTIVPVRLAVD